jgi:hypothetical protein
MMEGDMTITQILGLAIGILALLLSSELVRSMAARQRRPEVNIEVGFRRVGTFGSLTHFGPETAPVPCIGSSVRALVVILVLAVFLATGITVKVAWDKTHPDIRSAHGRAYEACVRDKGVSRWNVQEVNRCVDKGRSSWN